ncbi:nitroreductase/quinone reductase family protein [Terrabacter sp. BE26]|uniref:nitroreductase/quinone reductase family protein n=1 Tax=Terrabacter sp. BE26 TaxID=2898152 RepID=UPI0035BE8562
MASMTDRLWGVGNRVAVWLYRRTAGRVGGTARQGTKVLLLTVPGRHTGNPHTVPVGYVERDGAYYVAASAGGRPSEPQWIRNLRASPTAAVQVGPTRRTASVEVLRGAERDAAWNDVIVATLPFFADYERKAGRTIAVARLTPTA